MYLLVVTVLKLILIVFIIYQTDIAIGVSQISMLSMDFVGMNLYQVFKSSSIELIL
jgi:hypothetical protein